MTLRRSRRNVTSPALRLAAQIDGGIVHVRPDAEPRRKYRERERDTPRMLWTKAQPCCAYDLVRLLDGGFRLHLIIGPCAGPVEADHAGRRGRGRKADDDTVIPLCVRHHREPGLDALLYGLLKRGAMREAKDRIISRQRGRYAAHLLTAARAA